MPKNYNKKYMIVLNVLYYLVLFKLVFLQLPPPGVAAVTDQQRKNADRIKSELARAFDREERANGAMVQPSWTKGSEKDTPKQAPKVEVNAQNRKEAAALRAEIFQAVAKDKYAAGGGAKSKDIKQLEDSFGTKEKGKDVLQSMVGSVAASEEHDHVGAVSVDKGSQDSNNEAPNIITANLGGDSEIDIRKLQRLEVAKRRTKEVLILKYIEEDFSFDLGYDVLEWEHIVHGGQEFFIGRRLTDLLVVKKDDAKYEKVMVVDVGHPITYLETYTYWNLEQQQREGVILVATGNNVLWYRANQESHQIELYWDWMVGNTVTGLTHITLDSNDYLTVSSNQSSLVGHYALNIYQYKLETKEFWIAQRLQLEHPCDKVTILNTGRDVILAIPQNNTAAIYTFNPHEAAFSHIRFQLKRSVPAEGILTIAGFKMGGRSYLALTGYQPQILLYQQGDFISKTILGNNFGLVELFFPIPVRTYRDDLILLVQHRVDFSTHTLTVVETLIWDGEAFETSIPVPCHLGKYVVYGVSCMLDLQRDEGLKGAALLRRGDDISVIVPRFKAESGLFRFHTELLAKNSELLDLQEIFSFLQDWVKEQLDLLAQAETFLHMPDEELIKLHSDLTALESLKTPEFIFSGEVGEIYVNDHKWTAEDSNIDLDILIQSIEDLDKSLNSGRQRRNLYDIVHDNLTFDDLVVDNLEVENVNGIPFFVQNRELTFAGTVEFSELEVLDTLIGLQKRQVNDEDFFLEGDLEFDWINNVKWSVLKENLVFRNQKQNFVDLEVKGEVLIEKALTINTLNTLDFPDDFLLSSGPSTSIVKVEKYFTQTLSASAIDTDGLINGKNPLQAITLMDPQDWEGMPTFKHLEVSEILELKGKVQGSNVESFPKNPTLQEAHIIEASCHFNELVVNGPVVLKGDLDGKPLGPLLKDILLKPSDPAEEILVPSLKTFNLVVFPTDFHLENNTINQIPVTDFVTAHTNQTLHINALEGYVYFYNLTLNGSYDGVKIEDLLKEVLMLDKPIDLSSTELIFSETLKSDSKITIFNSINRQPIKDNFQTLQENLILKTAEFEHLQTQQADFLHDILGKGKLNNIEMHTFVPEMSWHEPPIRGNIFLNELILEKGLQTDELHGIKSEFLLDFIKQIDELPDMVLNGQIQVDHITITGDVQLHKLNGQHFDEDIQLTTIKLNHPNYLSTKLSFQNRLDIKGQLNVIGNFRGDYLPDIIDDMVIRTSNSIVDIKAPKSFLNSIKVLQNTQAEAINAIPLENFAWKTKENNVKGSLNIKGNLMVRDVHIQGTINNYKWQELQNLLYYDVNLQNFVLRNTTQFDRTLFLEDLTVLGNLNEVPNLTDFFKNVIYKNNACLLKGKNTFTGRVSIDKGAHIKYLNGQDLEYLFNNLVFIDDGQPVVIKAPVHFEGPTRANDIQVKDSMEVQQLTGCSVADWLENSLRVDQDQTIQQLLQFSAGCLDDNSLSVRFVQDIDLSRIITLFTPQTFTTPVTFSDVYLNGFISSKGPVNKVDLKKEFENTLMTWGGQHISTPLTIQSIVVQQDLTVRGLVNGDKDLQDVATLQEDLVLESPLYFQSIYSPQVIMKDLITGVDLDKWFKSSVKLKEPKAQLITGNWTTKNLIVKTGAKNFQYMINGFEPWQYYSYIRAARSNTNNQKDSNDEEKICPLMLQIWRDILKKSIYLKYVEKNFNINLGKEFSKSNEPIRRVFHLKSKREDLLLININCSTFIYKWLASTNKFVFKTSYLSGPIDQIELIDTVANSSKLEFITVYDSTEEVNCSLKPANMWKEGTKSVLLKQPLPEVTGPIYKSYRNSSSLWTLDNDTIREFDLELCKFKYNWQLPVDGNKTNYRFVPYGNDRDILMTNGENIILFTNHLAKKSINSDFNTQLPKIFLTNDTSNKSESILKPNSPLTKSFVFADFKQIVERILIDLGQRLNQEINITQLSIPESDLFDEHLIPDFLAIMEELRRQNIYSSEVININYDKIIVPQNPAQVLAARVVQIVWPVVVEMEEIHSYLRSNSNHDHPLCSSITNSVGFLIKDVLTLANDHSSNKDPKDYNEQLTRLIQRIRDFESDLYNFVKVLEKHEDVDNSAEAFHKEEAKQEVIHKEYRIFSQDQVDLIFVESSHLPGYKEGEILNLQVGSPKNPLHLWAVTSSKSSFTLTHNPGIYIYLPGIEGQLYQVITAVKPRSLQQLRVKQETLLVYIEDCCQVQVLRYRGSQGFVKFSEIRSKTSIQQVLAISLPSTRKGSVKFLLIVVLEKNIQFYDFVIEGFNLKPRYSVPQLLLDCMSQK